MAQQPKTATQNAAERILAGEQLADVFGVTEGQIQAIAALAFNLQQQGKLKEAEILFRGLIAANEKIFYGYAGLGALALAKQPVDLPTAYENLSKAAQLNPKDPTVQANLGEVLVRQGKVEEAAKHFKTAFELDSQHKDPGVNRARAIVASLAAISAEAKRRTAAA
ncbi:MAG TPA: tetratricopeptide repeat protein [Terriglobales bacterium]|jgi:tetratricopeptide (TPR) repeat protein|nr:tetratricopeptide repeat protein [Terriglobales bacterium]